MLRYTSVSQTWMRKFIAIRRQPQRRQQLRSQYNFAIARQLPDSFPNAISMEETTNNTGNEAAVALNMERAKEQHRTYVEALRKCCVPVLELPVATRSSSSSSSTTTENPPTHYDDEYPDGAFVEDTVIAIGPDALLTRMGHVRRRGEGDAIAATLEQLGMNVCRMDDYYDNDVVADGRYGGTSPATGRSVVAESSSVELHGELGTVDGGDVLYTGRHIYVGLSDRTNMEGANFVRQFFRSHTVIVVPKISLIPGKELPHSMPLHLKSAVTHIDSHTLVMPTGPYGDYLERAMNVHEFAYKVHRVPDLLSCNVISCNGHVIVQETDCPQSQEILYNAVMDSDQDYIRVDTSELAKKDAALTCCSVLLEV